MDTRLLITLLTIMVRSLLDDNIHSWQKLFGKRSTNFGSGLHKAFKRKASTQVC